jgi:metallo-beta-lactamase class B
MLRALTRVLLLCAVLLAGLGLWFLLSPAALQRAYSVLQQDNGARPPIEIARGVYFIGAADVASYAIDTGEGLIVIDAGYEDTAPQVLANLRALGFDPRDVRLLLNTHAHFDHAGGLAQLQRATGAPLLASPLDAAQLRRGGAGDFYLRDFWRYPPAAVARELADGEAVTLGAVTLTAHFTPGHTKGCTSWSFPVTLSDGRAAQALIICSLSTLTFDLVDNPDYPGIAADYRRTYALLDRLPCEMFLGAHGRWFDLEAKRARAARGEHDVFHDPGGCQEFIAESRQAFEAELARQGGAR